MTPSGRDADGASTWCILVAAGSGSRLGGDRPKAFAPLGGRALVAESLERLDGCDWIEAIVIAAPPGWEEPTIVLAEELVTTKVTAVVTGGATRAESVAIALGEVADEAAVILVHDAARPFVGETVIERLLVALGEGFDGAVPGLPVADTIKRVDRDVVVETPARDSLVAVQTPQAFLADALRRAYAGPTVGATDCASLVERVGGRIKVVEGDPLLLKVTTAADLELAERLLADARR